MNCIGASPFCSTENPRYWPTQSSLTGQAQGAGSGQPPVPTANGLTGEQMTQTASFSSYDFGPDGMWAMSPGATHPVLRWQLESH